MGLLDLGNAKSVVNFLSTPTLDLSVTISIAGMKLVGLNVSLIREGTSLEKTMEPIGNLIRTVTNLGFQDNDHDYG